MRILIVLTYYRPHTSGLTIYVERLSKALVKHGHDVTVLTSRFNPNTPSTEVQDGVCIMRAPVLFRISKGVIMPTFGWLATKLVAEHDVVHLHLPQFDAAGIAMRGRLLRKPTIITYHCDLKLPPGVFNSFVNLVVHGMNHLAAFNSNKIVTYTQDFADHSPYLRSHASKVHIIPPPVEYLQAAPHAVEQLARSLHLRRRNDSPVIGMAARLAAEKGVQVLLDSLPGILSRFPNATVLFAGQYKDVLGEEAYYQRLIPRIRNYEEKGHWKFLGILTPQEMAAFYPNLDVLVVPSLNSTESFGLVQIEAMMNNVPVVASNLPGVRQPVRMTGMGEIAEVGDARSLTENLLKILENHTHYRRDPAEIIQRFSPSATACAYETLFGSMLGE